MRLYNYFFFSRLLTLPGFDSDIENISFCLKSLSRQASSESAVKQHAPHTRDFQPHEPADHLVGSAYEHVEQTERHTRQT